MNTSSRTPNVCSYMNLTASPHIEGRREQWFCHRQLKKFLL
jgi:hypothetical protein